MSHVRTPMTSGQVAVVKVEGVVWIGIVMRNGIREANGDIGRGGDVTGEDVAASASAEQKFMSLRANNALGEESVLAVYCSAQIQIY